MLVVKKGIAFRNVFKIFGIILALIGLVPVLYEMGFISFLLPEFISASIVNILLAIGGILILVTSFNDSFLGRRWLALLVGIVLAAFGVYLVGVDWGYISEFFVASEFFKSVALIVYGVYILIKDYI